MVKKRLVMLGIILFAASLFPLNAPAEDPAPNNAPTKDCIKVKDESKANQANQALNKKPAKRKH